LLAVWFETKNKVLAGTLLVLAVLVGIGRVLALVHTPLDVVGGVFAACVGAIWYLTAPDAKKHSTKK
jgi:membrane-associated phospholipid phosphatase